MRRPRFVDISRDTWNLDAAAAAIAAVGDATRAVIAVSFAGLPVDLEPLARFAIGVVVIEDGAHALGAGRERRTVGGPGGADMTTFSLHPVKAMTTGEGGLVATEDDELARRLRLFRTHGITRRTSSPSATEGGWYYEMQALGFNYRITDFQCALGLSQLDRLDDFDRGAKRVAAQYRELLADETADRAAAGGAGGIAARLPPLRHPRLAGAEARLAVFEHLRARGHRRPGALHPDLPARPTTATTLGYPQDAARPPRSTTRAPSRCRCFQR